MDRPLYIPFFPSPKESIINSLYSVKDTVSLVSRNIFGFGHSAMILRLYHSIASTVSNCTTITTCVSPPIKREREKEKQTSPRSLIKISDFQLTGMQALL